MARYFGRWANDGGGGCVPALSYSVTASNAGVVVVVVVVVVGVVVVGGVVDSVGEGILGPRGGRCVWALVATVVVASTVRCW